MNSDKYTVQASVTAKTQTNIRRVMNSDKYTVQASVTAKTQTKSLNFLALGDGNTAEIKDIRECPLAIEYPVAEVTKRVSSDLGTTETGKTHLNFAGTMLKPSYLKACYL